MSTKLKVFRPNTCLVGGWRVAGGWLVAGWWLAGGWLVAGSSLDAVLMHQGSGVSRWSRLLLEQGKHALLNRLLHCRNDSGILRQLLAYDPIL